MTGAVVGVVLVLAGARVTAFTRRRAAWRRLGSGSRETRWVPDVVRETVSRRLRAAEVDVPVDDALVTWLGVAAGAVVVAGTSAPAFGLVAGAAVLAAGPWVLAVAAKRTDERVRRAVPELLARVSRDLRSGGTVRGALERNARLGDDAGRESSRLVARLSAGASLDDALTTWSQSRGGARARASCDVAASALGVAAALGGRAADAIEGVAEALRSEAGAEAEARALAAQGRASARVLGALPLSGLLFNAAFDERASAALFTTPAGVLVSSIGLALGSAGILWMRRIVGPAP